MSKLESLGLVVAGRVTDEGWQVFSEFLDRVGPYPNLTPGIIPSPHNIFMKFMPKTVPTAIEMVVLNPERRTVFLTPRNDKYWQGPHFPGSYMTPGQHPKEICQRIADKETPGIVIEDAKIIGCSTAWNSPRFHDTSAITLVKYDDLPTEGCGAWYSIDNPPENLIECHRPFIPIIKRHLLLEELIRAFHLAHIS